MTPTGDYYTVQPLSAEKARELVELGVKTVIVPGDVFKLDALDAERILFEAGIAIRHVPLNEISLTATS